MRALTLALIGTVAISATAEAREKRGYVSKLSHTYSGKCSWFNADGEEHVAIKPPTTDWYVACRWDYAALAKQIGCKRNQVKSRLARCTVRVRRSDSNRPRGWHIAEVCDWGPGRKSRMIDLSPRLMAALGVTTDDVVEFLLEER